MALITTKLDDNELIFLDDKEEPVKRLVGNNLASLKDYDALCYEDFDDDTFYLSDNNLIRCEEDIIYGLPNRTILALGPTIPDSNIAYRCVYLNQNSFYYANGGFDIPMRVTAVDETVSPPKQVYSVFISIQVNCDDHKIRNITTPDLTQSKYYGLMFGNAVGKTFDSNGFWITSGTLLRIKIDCFPPNGLVRSTLMTFNRFDWLGI